MLIGVRAPASIPNTKNVRDPVICERTSRQKTHTCPTTCNHGTCSKQQPSQQQRLRQQGHQASSCIYQPSSAARAAANCPGGGCCCCRGETWRAFAGKPKPCMHLDCDLQCNIPSYQSSSIISGLPCQTSADPGCGRTFCQPHLPSQGMLSRSAATIHTSSVVRQESANESVLWLICR